MRRPYEQRPRRSRRFSSAGFATTRSNGGGCTGDGSTARTGRRKRTPTRTSKRVVDRRLPSRHAFDHGVLVVVHRAPDQIVQRERRTSARLRNPPDAAAVLLSERGLGGAAHEPAEKDYGEEYRQHLRLKS